MLAKVQPVRGVKAVAVHCAHLMRCSASHRRVDVVEGDTMPRLPAAAQACTRASNCSGASSKQRRRQASLPTIAAASCGGLQSTTTSTPQQNVINQCDVVEYEDIHIVVSLPTGLVQVHQGSRSHIGCRWWQLQARARLLEGSDVDRQKTPWCEETCPLERYRCLV